MPAAAPSLRPPPPAGEETRIGALLQSWSDGRSTALDDLMPLVVAELRRLAQYFFDHEPRDHTLQPTALVNEIYLHLRDRRRVRWRDRGQFFGYAAQAMRRLLVDHARARRAEKRGGGRAGVPLDEVEPAAPPSRAVELIALDAALDELAALDPRQARVVELIFFAGLRETDVAAVLGVSERTVRRDWSTARLWLARKLRETP